MTEPWTPGPWHYGIVTSYTPPMGYIKDGPPMDNDGTFVNLADARIASLAPEMAELLQRWHETGVDTRFLTGDDGTVPPSLAEDTQALLARARGEA